MRFFLLFMFFSNCVALKVNYLSVIDNVCEKYVHYEPMCYFYDFSKDCYPWNVSECNVLFYSAHEPNCITYECSVRKKKTMCYCTLQKCVFTINR